MFQNRRQSYIPDGLYTKQPPYGASIYNYFKIRAKVSQNYHLFIVFNIRIFIILAPCTKAD